jgi:hypothetical protein
MGLDGNDDFERGSARGAARGCYAANFVGETPTKAIEKSEQIREAQSEQTRDAPLAVLHVVLRGLLRRRDADESDRDDRAPRSEGVPTSRGRQVTGRRGGGFRRIASGRLSGR